MSKRGNCWGVARLSAMFNDPVQRPRLHVACMFNQIKIKCWSQSVTFTSACTPISCSVDQQNSLNCQECFHLRRTTSMYAHMNINGCNEDVWSQHDSSARPLIFCDTHRVCSRGDAVRETLKGANVRSLKKIRKSTLLVRKATCFVCFIVCSFLLGKRFWLMMMLCIETSLQPLI